MIPTYVINLKRQPERRALMAKLLADRGIEPIWVDAVDASNPTEQELSQIKRMPNWGPWGEFRGYIKGVNLSHLRAIQAFLDTTHPYGLIMEDDVHISSDMANWLASTDWIPHDADLVKVERWRDDRLYVMRSRAASPYRNRLIRRLESRHVGGAGYILSRGFANRLINQKEFDLAIDHLLFNPAVSELCRGAKIYQVEPALVQQGNEPLALQNNGKARPVSTMSPQSPMSRAQRWHQAWIRGVAELWMLPVFIFRLTSMKATLGRIPMARDQ